MRAHAPKATIATDPLHGKVVPAALDVVLREAWNELRQSGNPAADKKFNGARWAPLTNPYLDPTTVQSLPFCWEHRIRPRTQR